METNDIIKKESVGYLKSSLNLQQGTLVMTSSKISLEAHKAGVGGFGLLGALLKSKIEKSNVIFDLEFKDVQTVAQGKQGINKNVLEITDRQNVTHRITVKNYPEWEAAIKGKMA
jgi:hypothetical protein